MWNSETIAPIYSEFMCKSFLYLYHTWACTHINRKQLSSVQLHSHVRLFATPWFAARQASLSITNSQSLLKLMSIESVLPSSHLILCHPLLLLPPIPPSIRVFSNELILCMRWPKYWSLSFSISPSNEHPGLIFFRMDWLDLLQPRDSQESSPTLFPLFPHLFPMNDWTRWYDLSFLNVEL